MNKKWCLAVLLGALPIVTGCGNQGAGPAGGSSADGHAAASAGAHDHPSEGPHHGALVELGNEEYHAEVVHTGDTVTVYILDASATQAVPIDAQDVTINVVHDNQPEQFKLTASPDAADGAGKSSRFALQDAELVEHLDSPAAAPKLMITINGTPYRGEVHHDHDHAGHDHAEHDHAGHDHAGHDH
ncbi:MAG: hypothetical protein ACTHOU_09005 [Aureliella sp.]